ncbi:MAG: hypothetical protein WKF30_11350 [Pyrinomonadaceae bacterium]
MPSITSLRPIASFISTASAVKSFFRKNNQPVHQKAATEESVLSLIGDIKAAYAPQTHSQLAVVGGPAAIVEVGSHDCAEINLAAREMTTISPIVIENQSDIMVLELAQEAAAGVIFDDEDILEIG